MIKMRAITS